MFAGPGGDVGGADEARIRAARAGLLGLGRSCAAGRDVGLRAVAQPAQRPVKPGGILKLTSERYWSPSSRSSFRVNELKSPARGLEVPAISRGLNGPHLARALPAVGPGGDRDERRRVLGRQRRVPRNEVRFGVVERALRRRREQAAVGREQMQVEGFERHLRQVRHRSPSAGRSPDRDGRRRELRVDPEAIEDHEQPVLVAGLRFADVERPVDGSSSAGVRTSTVPIFELSGHLPAESCRSPAWVSLHEV